MSAQADPLEIALDSGDPVDGLLTRPPEAWLLYLLAHGAGAGMTHRLMSAHAAGLAARGIATLRYQFPYMQAGRRRVDPQPKLLATVRAAARAASDSGPPICRSSPAGAPWAAG